MKFLFVYERFITGGIETLILRMSNWMVDNGHSVTILLGEGGELIGQISKKIDVIILGKTDYHKIRFPLFNRKKINAIVHDVDIIMSFSRLSLMLAGFLSIKNQKSKIIAGVFGPWIFKYDHLNKDRLNDIASDFFDKVIPDENKVFMSRQILLGHAENFSRNLDKANDWPLPIDSTMFSSLNRKAKKGKVVSIGRLTSFKTYNLYFLDVLSDAKKCGMKLEWHIYGDEDGSDESIKNEMLNKIKNLNLSNDVFMHGNIRYDAISTVLQDAWCFIGMGTTLPEAAYCRIPCIPAIANIETPKTYGMFYDLPLGSNGERIVDKEPDVNIIDLLSSLYCLNDEQYVKEEQKTFDYVQFYSMDNRMQEFIKIAENSIHGAYMKYLYFSYLPIVAFRVFKKKIL